MSRERPRGLYRGPGYRWDAYEGVYVSILDLWDECEELNLFDEAAP